MTNISSEKPEEKIGTRIAAVEALDLGADFNQFANFVLSSGDDEHHPNLENMDLMLIPRLVPNVYILDFREGIDDGLLMKFAGTAVEANYPSRLQGNYLDKAYTGHDRKELFMNVYRRSYKEAASFSTRRVVRYIENQEKEKYRLATVLFYVCFSKEKKVDYGIGYAKYEFSAVNFEPTFQWL